MRRATLKAREEFIGLMHEHVKPLGTQTVGNLIRDEVTTITSFAQRLLRYGATLGRIAEDQCNGYRDWRGNWDEKAEKRAEAKETRIQNRVTELCKRFGCTPVFQGDPRGNVLKIVVPDGYTNDWGREGIGVPTS